MKKLKRILPLGLLVVILLSGLVGCGSTESKSDNKDKDIKTYKYDSQEIKTTHNIKTLGIGTESSGLTGHIFSLGYAMIGDDTYYYVYAEEMPGKFLLKKYNAENTYICEDDSQPRVENTYKYIKVSSKLLADMTQTKLDKNAKILIDNKEANVVYDWCVSVSGDRYTTRDRSDTEFDSLTKGLSSDETLLVANTNRTLYVPKGTIKVKYDVTLPPTK